MKKTKKKYGGILISYLLFALPIFSQNLSITGVVKDGFGEPVIGGNVIVKGTAVGAITDIDGKYAIKVSSDSSILVFTYLGMITEEIVVGNRREIDVVLREAMNELEELIVIGYGVQKKRDLTGSIASLKANDITAIPTSNALEAMQGKVAGLDMNKNSGEVGGGLNFTLRGTRSLNASNAPLILVDGISYGSTLDINPSDIESIEVLKDASSTAIYGTRGANGVILITTKKGKSGKTKISLNTYIGSTQVVGQPNIMTGEEYVALKREAYRTAGITDDSRIFAPMELEYIKKGYYTEWGDLALQKGFVQNYELNVAGGNDKTSISFSLGYMGEKGLFKKEGQERINFRLSADHAIANNLKVGANVLYTYKDNDKRRDPLNMAYKIVPVSRPYDDDGNFILYPAPGYTSQMNPLADEQSGMYVNNVQTKRMFASGYLDWKVSNALFFKTTFGADMTDVRRGWYYGKNSIDGGGSKSQSGIEVGNSIVSDITANPGQGNAVNYTWENVLNFAKNVGAHDIQALVGTSTIYNRNEAYGAMGKNQVSFHNEFYNLASNSEEYAIGSNLSESKLASFFGRVNYKFTDRYLLSLSLRADGSSTLAEGNKWGYFPSAALGWRLKEEVFLDDAHWLQDLKLRLSWGQSGNSAISPYQTLGNLGQSTYGFGENPAYGYFPHDLANKNLSWETTTTSNIGLDFGFIEGRIAGSVDAYIANTNDLLMERIVVPTSGFLSAMDNIGKTRNTGIEFTLRTINMSNHSPFQWNTDLTLSHNKEEIMELANGMMQDELNGWFVGEPVKVWYDYHKIGIWQLGQEADAAKNGQKPGDIRVETTNADGKVTTSDRQILGTPRPKFSFGLNNRFEFKGLDLYVFIYGKLGQMIRTEAIGNYKPDGLENGLHVDYWTSENPTNAYPRPNKEKNAQSTSYYSTLSYIDGSFWKIRDITIGYTLPSSLTQKAKIASVRFYGTIKNYFTFCNSRLKPFDPERNLNGSTSVSFPMNKEIVLGVNFNF
jgi:TonB-linked SusC/RagA family outer membrane protein